LIPDIPAPMIATSRIDMIDGRGEGEM